VLTVGGGMMFANISDAIAAAQNGDTIAVLAGTYVDVSSYSERNIITAANITMVGIGGMVHMEMGKQGLANGKGLLVVENGLTIRNFEFSGMTDGSIYGNLAGIRHEGGNLVIENCYFHDGQEGILGGVAGTTVTIDHSEFARLGAGDGYSHGIYIGNANSLTITNSYFHEANVGHEIKSRALSTVIENNVIADLNGTASYDIDIPNGGNLVVENNTIEKGPNA
jgi:hypothetical protein